MNLFLFDNTLAKLKKYPEITKLGKPATLMSPVFFKLRIIKHHHKLSFTPKKKKKQL